MGHDRHQTAIRDLNTNTDLPMTPTPLPKKSFIRLDPDASDEDREAAIMEWLEEILGPVGDEPAPSSPSTS